MSYFPNLVRLSGVVALLAVLFVGLTACDDSNVVSSEDETAAEKVASSSANSLTSMYPEVLDLDYYPSQGFHVLSFKKANGEVDTYYGDDKSWTKLNDNRDAGVAWGKYEAMSVGDNGDFVYAFLFNGDKVAVQSGREFYNKPFFDTGKYIIKDGSGNTYDKVLDLDFYPSQGFHVLSVKNTSTGAIDTYYGDDKGWTKLNDNRDAGVAWGEYQAMSVGDNGDFVYAFLFGSNKKVAVQSGREFYNKPFFDTGKYIID